MRVVCVLAIGYLPRPVEGQAAATSMAAIPSEKGGQDVFGAYNVAQWPKPLTSITGHENWTWGAGQYVFAESPNRVFVLQRGELPVIKRPQQAIRLPQIGPSIEFPMFRLPMRDATTASPPGALFAKDGKTPGDDLDAGMPGVDYRWEHIVTVFDAQGNLIEDWTQWDKMFRRPHAVYISPYDPEKNVWIVDDYRHAIFKFSNDGKKLLQTIGEPNVPGTDEKHFYRPTFMAWLPDGTFFVADGYQNTRVVKFDKDGKYLMTWGQRGERTGQARDASRLLQQRARRRRRSADAARVRQRSQQRPRAGVRREREVSRRVELRPAADLGHPHVHHHQRSVPLGRRSRHVEAAQVQPRRQVPLLVGRVG